jgi:hypothetical protein
MPNSTAVHSTQTNYKNQNHEQSMKHTKHLFIAVITASATFLSCAKQSLVEVKELDPASDAALIAGIEKGNDPGIPFPDGARVYHEAGKDKMRIVLPEGYAWLMTDIITDEWLEPADEGAGDDAAGVTCNCTSGSGCSPVKFKKKYYCVLGDGCNVCTRTTTRASGEPVKIAGIYNTSLGITLLTRTAAEGLKAAVTSTRETIVGNAAPALFRVKGVKETLMQLYHFIYEDNIPDFIISNTGRIPPGYVYAAINIYGNLAAIPIPQAMADRDFYLADADGGSATCRCNDANPGGCKKDSFLGAVFCDAGNCKSCSLLD